MSTVARAVMDREMRAPSAISFSNSIRFLLLLCTRVRYVVKTLDQFVTDDYILIYLHGGSTRSTLPPLPWLKKCYYLLNRRIRKSLKNLYMVHPTIWLKSIVWMARPFISTKFWRKLVYIRTLDDLYEKIPVERAAVPEKVKLYDRGIHN